MQHGSFRSRNSWLIYVVLQSSLILNPQPFFSYLRLALLEAELADEEDERTDTGEKQADRPPPPRGGGEKHAAPEELLRPDDDIELRPLSELL